MSAATIPEFDPTSTDFYARDDYHDVLRALRDRAPEFDTRGAIVLGVSPDDPASHRKFRAKYNLPFTLLADTEHAVAEKYGVWKEKTLYGRKYWGNERTTFVIGRDGRIEQVLERVKPAGHADDVLALL